MLSTYKVYFDNTQKVFNIAYRFIINNTYNVMYFLFAICAITLVIFSMMFMEFLLIIGGLITAIVVLPILMIICPSGVINKKLICC